MWSLNWISVLTTSSVKTVITLCTVTQNHRLVGVGRDLSGRGCLPACLSAPPCNVGTQRSGNDSTGQITYFCKGRRQLKHYSSARRVRAGLRTRWLQTPCCALTAEVISGERSNLPYGCSAPQLHLTPSHHLPANLSGRFSSAGRKKSARHIVWMLRLHPDKPSQKLLRALHVPLYTSGPEPQCSLISLNWAQSIIPTKQRSTNLYHNVTTSR